MPQLAFYARIASWVAPRGTLLVVGHLHASDTAGDREEGHAGPPAEASATAGAVAALLDPQDWEIVTAEELDRTAPGHSHGIRLDDVVVRAVRRR